MHIVQINVVRNGPGAGSGVRHDPGEQIIHRVNPEEDRVELSSAKSLQQGVCTRRGIKSQMAKLEAAGFGPKRIAGPKSQAQTRKPCGLSGIIESRRRKGSPVGGGEEHQLSAISRSCN